MTFLMEYVYKLNKTGKKIATGIILKILIGQMVLYETFEGL